MILDIQDLPRFTLRYVPDLGQQLQRDDEGHLVKFEDVEDLTGYKPKGSNVYAPRNENKRMLRERIERLEREKEAMQAVNDNLRMAGRQVLDALDGVAVRNISDPSLGGIEELRAYAEATQTLQRQLTLAAPVRVPGNQDSPAIYSNCVLVSPAGQDPLVGSGGSFVATLDDDDE